MGSPDFAAGRDGTRGGSGTAPAVIAEGAVTMQHYGTKLSRVSMVSFMLSLHRRALSYGDSTNMLV